MALALVSFQVTGGSFVNNKLSNCNSFRSVIIKQIINLIRFRVTMGVSMRVFPEHFKEKKLTLLVSISTPPPHLHTSSCQ